MARVHVRLRVCRGLSEGVRVGVGGACFVGIRVAGCCWGVLGEVLARCCGVGLVMGGGVKAVLVRLGGRGGGSWRGLWEGLGGNIAGVGGRWGKQAVLASH